MNLKSVFPTLQLTIVASFCLLLTLHVNADGEISFVTQHVVVEEKQYEEAIFNLRRVSGDSTVVFFYCKILNSTGAEDFVSASATGQFGAGETSSVCRFTVKEDNIPEANKTFIVGITIQAGVATIGTPSTASLTVLSNDDPYGTIGFEIGNQVLTAQEPLEGQTSVASFNVARRHGTIGTVMLYWQASSTLGTNILDLSPKFGFITFNDGESLKKLNISIQPDLIPENQEQYMIDLINVTGGASINSTSSRAIVSIPANDAPIRFQVPTQSVAESQTMSVTVTRGIGDTGTIGDNSIQTTVNYATVDGSARSGIDYEAATGTLNFSSGETQQNFLLRILKDAHPEIAENFTVVLSNPSSGSVLYAPYIMTVVIAKNDDPHGVISFRDQNATLVLDEDGVGSGMITVNRSRGTFGTVAVSWKVVSSSRSPDIIPSRYLNVTNGMLIFGPGISTQQIPLSVQQNNIAEEAVEFYIELVNVTGGARLNPLAPQARLIVRDSDNAYGVIFLGNSSEHRILLSATPRKILLPVKRSGGPLASVRVNYTAMYMLPGSSSPSSDVQLNYTGYTTLSMGSYNSTIEIKISESSFLKKDAFFMVTLTSLQLEKQTIIKPKTPTIGSPQTANVNITSELANGEIAFFNSPVNVKVDEPSRGNIYDLSLMLMRDGVSGPATVYWRVTSSTSSFTAADASPWSGVVYFPTSADRANITIKIHPDDIPEIDETFIVELTNVTEKNERLRTGGNRATVTINKNDVPGGTFEFNQTGHIFIQENGVSTVDVVRSGGALTTQRVQVTIVNGQNDFVSYQNVFTFTPNQRKDTFYIFATDDNIPEISENFTIVLTSIGDSALGNRTTLGITVSQNDDANGVFSFLNTSSNLIKYADEIKNSPHNVSFDVTRRRGTFSSVTVYWNVTSLSGASAISDLQTLSGVVEFSEGQINRPLSITIKPDQVPEGEERFQIHLTNITGGGRLAEPLSATLVVNPNDAPIHFLYPLHVTVLEGQTANFTISLNRTLTQAVTVYVSTIDSTASASSGDYVAAHNKPVVFSIGERNKTVSIKTINDNIPEIGEDFIVRLNGSTGDTVLITPTEGRITIAANDEPYGVFNFSSTSRKKIANEGETISLEILRARGTFGNFTITWEILSSTRTPIADNTEFVQSKGSVYFPEGSQSQILSVTARNDGQPELNETFYIRLTNVTGNFSPGNRGYLVNDTECSVLILPNDDPYGVIEFAPGSLEVAVAEDYIPGFKNATHANLTVDRKQGTLGTIKTVWQLFKASDVPGATWDLIFYGQRGSAVVESSGRPHSGTPALNFNSSNASYVQIGTQYQPTYTDGLSISLWIKPRDTSQGVLIAKRNPLTNAVIFKISLNISGDSRLIIFQANGHAYNITVPVSVNLLDGSWHALVFTLSATTLLTYLDGSQIGGSKALMSSVSRASGPIYLGASSPLTEHYTGALQDVRMYSSVLIPALVKEISTNRDVITPINGYLDYGPGSSAQQIFMKTIDNSIPEPETIYSVKLIGLIGDGRLGSSATSSRITILKSDNANGVFGFQSTNCQSSALENTTNISFAVSRTVGSFGNVRLNWEIRQSGSLASNDFSPATGSINFNQGETAKMISVRPLDDNLPELNENFELRLVSAVSTDGTVSSTPTSGASIKTDANKCNITILSNDNPYGIFQIMQSKPNVSGVVQALAAPQNINVAEEIGKVTLYVVRAQGVEGRVSCEWKTNQFSARGNIDFRDGVGTVTLQPGENSQTITVDIIDNRIPELDKIFNVQLYNPTSGAILGSAAYINVTILPSDDAFGVFTFANSSTNIAVSESSGAVVTLAIFRLGGLLGTVNVTWRLDGGNSDFSIQSGSVIFTNGQRTGQVIIPIVDDTIPELMEVFSVHLISVSKGRLAPQNTTATIRVSANDDPYGIFELSSSPIRVQEQNTTIPLTISRKGGDLGSVRVYYQTVAPASSSSGVTYATPNVDFIPVSGSVEFAQNQKTAMINVTILADSDPEPDEYIMVNLTSVTLINGTEVIPNSPRLGSSKTGTIVIIANDNANGILQLSAASLTVNEGLSGTFLNVTRKAGTFGEVSVRFSITSSTAVFGSDYQVSSYTVTLSNRQDSVAVPVQIVDDDFPEFNESFVIKLEASSLTGGAQLGDPKECVVTILENDYPYGRIGFATASLNQTVNEPGSGSTLARLTVLRSGGASGTAQVEWNATLGGQAASNDVTPVSGNVRFLSGDNSQEITLSILADDIPEDNEAIRVNLVSISNGKAVIDASSKMAIINILANDDPYGVVQFSQSSMTVVEKDSDYNINIPIRRTRGLFGTIRISYSTKTASVAVNKASSGGDYLAVVRGTVTMAPGIASANATVKILKDGSAELDEHFLVQIDSAEVIGLASGGNISVGAPNIVNVTVASNDQPFGLFGIYFKDTGTIGTTFNIREPESGQTTVTFEVRRTQGLLGTVAVSWRVAGSSTVNTSSDVSAASGGQLTFNNGESSKEFIVAVKSDNIPEIDEKLIVELYSATGGAVINTDRRQATLVIMANDGVGGRIGFSAGSRSKTVNEGQSVSFMVYRTAPAAGNVTLNWTISGINASKDFAHSSGQLFLLQGVTSTYLMVTTLNDSTPENHENFILSLSDPKTIGVSSSGAATLVPGDSTATIVIGASDEPHGIVEFSPRSQPIRVNENVGTIDLRIVRNMGNIGNILVRYQLNGIKISQTTTRATNGEDFNSTANNTVLIPDGRDSATIRVHILNDNIPEQDEAFYVNLTEVTVVGGKNITTPPKIGSLRSMLIQIEANDGTQGELAFALQFERITVQESIGSFNITVIRYKGNFGNVYAFYYLNRLTASASDFDIPGGVMAGGPVKIAFANGERERNITVFVRNDNVTETDEQFELGLTIQNAVNNGGVKIGSPSKALVTIAANDDANGVLRFASRSEVQYITEPEGASTANNTATFFVERLVGTFGIVNARWQLVGVSNESDVTPINGLITFEEGAREKNFQIHAVADNIPEIRKMYSVNISVVSGGARISSPNIATLIISANDDPHGLLSVRAMPSLVRTLNVEERSKLVKTVVRREGGTLGQISVLYQTRPETALSTSGGNISFGFDQVLNTRSAQSFHFFTAYGMQYLLLASSYRKQSVGATVTSKITTEPYESTLFRWQGSFVPLITLNTDGAVKWNSFEEASTTYVIALNQGSNGRYEVMSQVMKLQRNGTVSFVQNIATKGASDVAFFRSQSSLYMLITNMKDNSGNTIQQSQLLRWQGSQFALESASIATKGAASVAICNISGQVHVAVANNYDSVSMTYTTASKVYSWSDTDRRFVEVQSIQTHGAAGVECSKIGTDHYLLFTNSKASSRLYRYKKTSPTGFVEVQEIKTRNAQSGKFFSWNYTDYMVIAGNISTIYRWSNTTTRFINITQIPITNAVHIQPFTANDELSGPLQYLGATESSSSRSYLLRLDMLSDTADFVPRRGQLTFYEGQTSINLGLTVLLDARPEMDERFFLELSDPRGGASLAADPNLAITILSNDNAYGRMAFADGSLRVNVTEKQWNSILKLDVIREFGSFGQVSLSWNISSTDGSVVTDLFPTNGQVNLNQGISTAEIFVNVRADGISELNEEFRISLTSVSIAGAAASNRGPTINYLKNTAVVTILANNDPYGVVGWKNRYEITTEEREVNSSALLVISRSYGALGDIMISYETQQALNVSSNERIAIPGVDYVTQKSSVLMRKGEKEALVYVKVRHDNNTNVNEIFNVNITNVYLVSGTVVPGSPRIDPLRRLTEVVITETLLNRGSVQFEAPYMRRFSENVGLVSLILVRINGSEGSVGVHFTITAKNTSSNDFNPQTGLVTFSNNVSRANLNITIIDDNIAELDEILVVKLIKPAGGVKLGPMNEMEIIITENDYPYGLLSFNMASRVIDNVIEGQVVQLIVDRTQGRHRAVTVDWSCGSVAQSDLTPWQGTLTFAENVTRASIAIQTINDTVPELTERFTCVLTNARNGAAISTNNNATITILPNDKPYGIISIDASSRQLSVAEPMTGYSGIFSINVVRSVGFDGQVSVQWKISSLSGVDNSNATFNATSGLVTFASRVPTQRIFLQVLNDAIPEESKQYQLYLERATGGAELDIPANTRSSITVAASDNPYGTVQFSWPLTFNVSETIGYVNITMTRTGGLIGQLTVAYAASRSSAQPGSDFTPAGGTITFNPGEVTKVLRLNIIDDSIPELAEVITVNMTSVRVTSKELSSQVVNGIQVDTPPKIGANSTMYITINANDNPYGEIRFLESQRLVHESDGKILIAVNRTGGTFGTSSVSYSYTEGTAKNSADFIVNGSSLTFAPGERQKFIPVQIIDDSISEFQESFRLDLTSVSGPASLGSMNRINITIETSDNPFGLFGIYNTTLSMSVENPNTTRLLSFPLSRKDGSLGRSEVGWRVVRNTISASLVTEDIRPQSGAIVFEPNQRGPKMINITILTAGGPEEPEERFTLQVYSATGGAALDHAFTNVSITILKKGHPNGLFRVAGTVIPSSTISEPTTGTTVVTIPVQRDFGSTGAVNVKWSISSLTGTINQDLSSFNTTLSFANGETTKNIQLAILADNIPEMDEVFEVTLISADNGAGINNARSKVNFTISANDYPHGLFKLDQASKRFEFVASGMARRLHFSIDRTQGTIGAATVNIAIQYSEGGPSNSHAVAFQNGQNKVSTVFNISTERFLLFGANFTIRLQSVSLSGSGSTMGPGIDTSSSPLLIIIPEEAANSLVEFDVSSRYPTVSQSLQVTNVRISRRGLLGSISVQWRSGYPPASFSIGTINPSQGSISFAQGERTKSISFLVQIPSVVPSRLIYSVYLSAVSPSQGQPAGAKIGSSNTAVVDPHGLVEISAANLNVTVVEGRKATISVRRLLSTIGTIRVSYTTQRYIGSDAATEGVDYRPVTSTFEMIEGQTSATVNVDTIEDTINAAERDEFFYVVLTSVQPVGSRLSATSPRLSAANNRATVRIRDNDNPFGVISFKTETVRTQESSGQAMLSLQRTGGVFSRVSVLIRSIGGGESWQDTVISNLPASSPVRAALNARTQAASAVSPNQDYAPINKEIVFEELNAIPSGGQIKTVNISILQDSLAEPAEQIILLLTNVTGGAVLPSPASSFKDFSTITIDGNGLWNGKIGFTSRNAEVNEDGSAKVTLPLRRVGGAAQRIEVKWVIWSTVSNIAQQFVASSGSVFFDAGNMTSSITVQVKKDQIPEFASWFYVNLTTAANGAIIVKAEPGMFSVCNVTLLESDYPAGRIGFNDQYRFPVVTLKDVVKDIRVRRYDGTLKEVTVQYQTTSLVSALNDGDVVYTPARENQDYQSTAGLLTFPVGSTEQIINIRLTPNTASSGSYPKIFNVTLISPTNGAILYDAYKTDQVIISKDAADSKFLALRSSALRVPLTDREIENIFTEMLQLVKIPPLSDSNQNLVMRTIRLITSYKSSLPAGQRALTNSSKATLLDIYDSLLSSTRTDTRGKSAWAVLLDELAYNFLEDMSCPFTFTGSKSNFAITSRRDYGSSLNGVKFASGRSSDFFRYPVNMFSSTGSSPCTDIHFIDYGNQQFFSSGKPVLNNKVMSSKIKSGLGSGMKVVYRVHTSNSRVTQAGASCVIWSHPSAGAKGNWKGDNCKIRGQTKDYVECECRHLSEYAVLASSDDKTGYEIYFYVSCYFTIAACFLALFGHSVVCSRDVTVTAKLLMHMLFATMMTNILYVVAAHISPNLMTKTTDCGVLALAIHYFFLAQFTWMFAQACNLWRILIMNDEHTDRKFIHFFIMGWGIPIIIIVGYILVTYAAYRWPFSSMYGDVHNNGDMCFISNGFAALGSVILPVIIFILGAVIVFVQAYLVKSQWKCYDDVYRGRYNIKELCHLFTVFALMCVTWLFAGLHLAFGSLWMIITFTVFNFLLGLYILVIYGILRNGMRCLCYDQYAVRATSSNLLSEHELIYAPTSLNHSNRKLIDTHSNHSHNLSDWAEVELPANLNPMDFPDKAPIIDSPIIGNGNGRVNESYDIDSDEFDDLIFALKTGGQLDQLKPEEQEFTQSTPSPRPVSADQPQIRRIKIADTHL